MKRTYFISDLHLGASYIGDARAHEARVLRFLDSIAPQAQAIYLLGDVLDYWYEYRKVVPRGHVRFFGKLAQLADAGVKITWLTGNHDVWLFDYLSHEIGLTVHKSYVMQEIAGRTYFLSHGDDVGRRPRSYRFMRWCFHSRVCQCLYAAIHPRWTTAVATGWSAGNRTGRQAAAVAVEQERCASQLISFAREHHASHPQVAAYLFGHLHLARFTHTEHDGSGVPVVFLGDWIDQDTYAVLDEAGLRLEKFTE